MLHLSHRPVAGASALRTPLLAKLLIAVLAVLAQGCGSCADQPAGDAPGLPAKVTLLSAPLAGIEAPIEVLAYGGTGPLRKLLTDLGGLATHAGWPVPPLEEMLGSALKAELGLMDEKVIDLDQGIRFAVVSPKLYPSEPVAMLFGTTSKENLVAALPKEHKAGDEGNAYSYLRYAGSTEAVYVNFVLNTVVVTRDKAIFPQYRNFFERLALAEVSSSVSVIVALRNLAPIYGADLDAALAGLKKDARSTLSAIPGADGQGPIVDALADGISRWVKELDSVRFNIDTPADGLRAEVSFEPRPGSDLSRSFKGLKGSGTGALLDRLPADAPFFLWINARAERVKSWMGPIAQATVGAMLKSDPPKQAEYVQAMVDLAGALGGELVMASHGPVTGDGLAFTSLFSVSDPVAARAGQVRLSGVYKEPGAVEYYKKVGLEVEMKDAAYSVGDVPVGVFTTRIAPTNTKLGPMKDGLQELLTQHLAIGKEMGVVAIGSDARATVEAVLGGKLKGGLKSAPGPARAWSTAAPGTLALLYVSPIDLVRRVRLSGMNPAAELLKDISTSTGIALSLGSEAGALKLVFDLPIEQVQKLGQVAQKAKVKL